MTLRVQMLGPLRAWKGERELTVGPPLRQAVLAILALRANQVVSREELLDAVWGDRLPASAGNNLRSYIAELRRAIESEQILTSSRPGYLLGVDPGGIDTEVFDERLMKGRDTWKAGNPESACGHFDIALGLWHGPALVGVPGPFAESERIRLGELRLTALEDRAGAKLDAGHHAEVAAEMAGLVGRYPFRERIRGLHILALYRSGRQAEALEGFQSIRCALIRELGIEPGPELKLLQKRILAADPGLNLIRSGRTGGRP